jgi:hypothetical protein
MSNSAWICIGAILMRRTGFAYDMDACMKHASKAGRRRNRRQSRMESGAGPKALLLLIKKAQRGRT